MICVIWYIKKNVKKQNNFNWLWSTIVVTLGFQGFFITSEATVNAGLFLTLLDFTPAVTLDEYAAIELNTSNRKALTGAGVNDQSPNPSLP